MARAGRTSEPIEDPAIFDDEIHGALVHGSNLSYLRTGGEHPVGRLPGWPQSALPSAAHRACSRARFVAGSARHIRWEGCA
ncbi:hypothetical protein DB31_7464 [Hyalangium minutum]|uniref:Uncharacterized protein n=1 Tax=Hyalangium minutum TaxID=394096 RepID=A0A085WKL4_9BACT|nr:hypothetical protein DB31_7464 [Hyalangium minutum]